MHPNCMPDIVILAQAVLQIFCSQACSKCSIGLPPVVYATDRSKAVIPVLFLFRMTLWFILRSASCLVLPCSLSSRFFSPFSIVITSLGEEGAGLCASRAFICLFCTR